VKNIKQKLLLSTLSAGLLLSMSGCADKSVLKPVSNNVYRGFSPLYLQYDNNNEIFVNKISNRRFRYSMRLNNYQPEGFKTNRYKIGSYGRFFDIVLFINGEPTFKTNFEESICIDEGSIPLDIMWNIIAAPMTLGTNLLAGGACTKEHIFNYDEFDEEAKDWIEDKNIKRKALLDSYSSLLTVHSNAFTHLIQEESLLVQSINTFIEKKSKEYKNQNPKIVIKNNDISGVYKGEKLKTLVTIEHNDISIPKIDVVQNYMSEIDRVFPCSANDECLLKMENAKTNINNSISKDLIVVKKEVEIEIPKRKKLLKQLTATLKVKADYTNQIFETAHKKLYYNIAKLSKEIKSKADKLTVIYNINKADFTNIFPSYSNEDKNIEIGFNPENRKLTITNKTEQFLEIESISLYYNDTIYNIGNKNEFSPNGIKTFDIKRFIKEANYENITKKSLEGKEIKFGFAIKYSTLQPQERHTLYKLRAYDLENLLRSY